MKSTHILGRPFPVTSHGIRGQGVFSVLVYKDSNPIMRLDPPDLCASLKPNSSSHHIVVTTLYEDGGGHTH